MLSYGWYTISVGLRSVSVNESNAFWGRGETNFVGVKMAAL